MLNFSQEYPFSREVFMHRLARAFVVSCTFSLDSSYTGGDAISELSAR